MRRCLEVQAAWWLRVFGEQRRRSAVQLSVLLLVFAAIGWVAYRGVQAERAGAAALRETLQRPTPTVPDRPDPVTTPRWGRLLTTPMVLTPPARYVNERHMREPGPTLWRFPGRDMPAVMRSLQGAGLATEQVLALMKRADFDDAIDGVTLRPTDAQVRALTPEQRRALYGRLSAHMENFWHYYPLKVARIGPDRWLGGLGLSESTRDLARSLMYREGQFWCFVDVPLLMRSIADAGERRAALRAVFRQATCRVELEIQPGQDVEPLVNYWGAGGRKEEVRPILEALAAQDQPTTVDIVHLLPAFARQRLYRYPDPGTQPEERGRDCHWTAMNFYNAEPDNRFEQKATAFGHLFEQLYALIPDEPRYGDLMAFHAEGGKIYHSAIFITDELVFTKNGAHSHAPWMFMRFGEMLDYYDEPGRRRLLFFRRKPNTF